MLCIFLATVKHGKNRSINNMDCIVKTPIENRQLPNDLFSLGCNMFVFINGAILGDFPIPMRILWTVTIYFIIF